MKHGLKKRILSLVLCISMVLPMAAVPMPVYSVENEESIAPLSNPFTPETIITLPDGTTTKSQSYRIPSMVTLADGTIVAAADIRWNTTYDGGGLDTLVARSTDDGQTWSYTLANYLGDNGNEYNYSSTTFIDPSLLVGADGQTVYMLTDLYAYGVALNGPWKTGTDPYFSYPIADTGFDANGNLKLSSNNRSSFGYYLKDGKIYANGATQPEAGYSVDGYFNITYTENNIEKTSNLFFEDSPFQVAKTQFLYLTKSTDGGATWSEPTLLNLRKTPIGADNDEDALLVSPGNAITTSDGVMVYPVYSYAHTPTSSSASASEQHLGLIYSTDGVNWVRTANFTELDFSSEGAVIELENGNLRVFFRNKTSHLCYVDYNITTKTWGSYQETEIPANSNTQLSAITYSKTFNGNQVVLVSCPTGPNEAGSANSDGSYRTNGKIFVGVVAADSTMTWPKSIDVGPYKATAQLQGSNYTEEQGFFAYSCLTERADGSIAILYENNQFGWGASGSNENGTYNPEKVTTYYTITGKSYSADAFGLQFDVDANAIYEELMGITTWEEWEEYVSWLDDEELHALQSLPQEHLDELERVSYYFYKEKVISMAPPAVDYTDAAPFVSLSARNSKAVVASNEEISPFARLRSSTVMSVRSNSPSLLADAEENGLILDKKAEKDGDKYKITLEAYTTGSVQAGEAVPSDIVLVLDLSTSMKEEFAESTITYTKAYPTGTFGTYYLEDGQEVEWCSNCRAWTYGCWDFFGHHKGKAVVPKTSASDTAAGHVQFYTKEESDGSRLGALKTAMQSFIAQVADQPSADRIALVGFHTESVLLAGNSDATAFMDATAYETTLLNAISGIDTGDLRGATEHGFGMERAVAVFDAQTTDYTNRNKVVILVTDGEPAPSGTGNWSSRTVKQAIEQSYILKSTHGASVYTISVMPGTDASNPTTAMDRYMDYLSSNYPNARYIAESIDNRTSNGYSYYDGSEQTIVNAIVPGTKVKTTGSYYLTAGNLAALNSIFGEIAAQTGGASINLDSTTQIKDIVSPYFALPDGATAANITVSTMDAVYTDGVLGWKASTIQGFDPTVTVEGKNVTVSGFDYAHNFVAETGRLEGDVSQAGSFHGRKLIITFYIKSDPDFLGGDGVVTNDSSSGVYDKDGNRIEPFEVPTVDVALKEIDTVAQDKHIYYGNTTDLTGILNLRVQESTSGKYLQGIANGINNAYVDLVYTVTLNNQTVVTYTIPAGVQWDKGTWRDADGTVIDMSKVILDANASYEIACTMTSKNNSDNAVTANANATIYVYKPVLAFKDVIKTPKDDNVAYDAENFVSVAWKNDDTLSTAVTMEGTKPTLTLTYKPDANCVDGNGLVVAYDDFYVNVTAKIGNKDITSAVTFVHQACVPACSFDAGKGEFMIHVAEVLTSLTIQKEGWIGQDIDPNQTFIFELTDIDGLKLTVTVHGKTPVTINGLTVNKQYTITEKTDWSWRYNCTGWTHGDVSGNGNTATITLGLDGTITFTNTRDEEKWLDGDSWCNNILK